MAHLSPAEALFTCERSLRQILAFVLSKKYGAAWLDKVAKAEMLRKWQRARATEERERASRGVTTSGSLLDYSDLDELIKMAIKTWDDLEDALGPQDELIPLLRRFDTLRNPTAHSRILAPFERDLLAGAAGQLQNKVTRYMTTRSPAGAFFPRITSAVDSYGNTPPPEVLADPSGAVHLHGGHRLVGDYVVIEGSAEHPDELDLEWTLSRSIVFPEDGERQVGTSASFKHTFTTSGSNTTLVLMVRTVGTEHLRFGPHTCDSYASFQYNVTPPPRSTE